MSDSILQSLKATVNENAWITDINQMHAYTTEWRDILKGIPLIVLLPDSVLQVSNIVKLCVLHKIEIIPQGGNTGLCGGAIPDKSGLQVLLSLKRLNKIKKLSKNNFSIKVEAGCILGDIQKEVEKHNLVFPVDMSSSGSCQIGGNISTNAGGTNVLKYGTTRAQVLGLEVVLPNGDIWNGLSSLRKDNSGYDLKQFFIGAEGTLGIITAATLKLYPSPGEIVTALLGIDEISSIQPILFEISKKYGNSLETFELISERAMRFVRRNISNINYSFDVNYPWYVLVEASQVTIDEFNNDLMDFMKQKYIENAVISKNLNEKKSLWRIRDSISAAQKSEGGSIKHDVSVPSSDVATFIVRSEKAVMEILPKSRVVAFGHVGDGNVHFNVSQPKDISLDKFEEFRGSITKAIYDCTMEFNGSICAEHGVGILKKADLFNYKSDLEINLMRSIKHSIDPLNIMNPGKVI